MTTTDATRHDIFLSAALAYAERGLFIIPLHEPLFDDAGKCCGCSCEAYKRSASNKARLENKGQRNRFDPNFKCRTPGKHPRLSDWEALASSDPAQIRKWWKKWPTANIGLAVGKSGLVTFDLDTYKEVYGEDDQLFAQADKETATQISGGGGEHLVFQMPAAKLYTNAKGTLPPGIDIRGVGGMQVLAPSMHPSGKQYEWEDGYSIFDIEPKPLPANLAAILDEAHGAHTTAKAVTFTTPTTERPELIRWKTSETVRALINAPGNGDRSTNDMKVCLSLCYAGATDDDILAVFQHYPIGTAGKYAEAGQRYLALTIGKARDFVEKNPRPDIGATVNALRLAIKTRNLTDHISPGPGSKKARLVADAILDLMELDQNLTITAGKKRVAALAGVAANTVVNALARLNGVLFNVTPSAYGYSVALVEKCRLQEFDPSLSFVSSVNTGGQKTANDKNEYSAHKSDDAFASGTSRFMKKHIRHLAQVLDLTYPQAQADYTKRGLGEGILLAYDTWARIGDYTAQEYAEETGLKLSAVRAPLRYAVALGLSTAEREGSRGPKVYSFAGDFWAKIDELASNLRTYRLSDQRESKRLESAQQWAKRSEALAATQEEKLIASLRFAKLARQRMPHLERLHPDLSSDDIKRLAYEVAAYKRSPQTDQAIRAERHAQHTEHRDAVALIRDLADSYADINTPLEEVYSRIMQFGSFDSRMVRSVLQSPKQMAKYQTLDDVRKQMRAEDLALPTLIVSTPPTYSHSQPALAVVA